MGKPFINKGNARELGRKGGKGNKGKSTLAQALINRKWCKPTCEIYFTCPFKAASEKKFKGKCALKEMPGQIQNWTVDVLTKGSEGMVESMRSMVLDIMIESKSGNLRDRIKALYALKDVHESAYGKFNRHEITGDIRATITAEDFKKAMKEVNE